MQQIESIPRKLRHIDCLRGYAILMVVACHTTREFDDLPWRFSQFFSSGWHGVQLFFLASTLTLLLSFDRERGTAKVNWPRFYLRRFFRIGPAYYLAALVYVVLGMSQLRSAAGLFVFGSFLNSWCPFDVGQGLVPGGWSISVEFSFYLLFPVIALHFHSTFRAVLLLALSVILAIGANWFASYSLGSALDPQALENFCYFSFWNQLPVFALGNLIYHGAYRRRLEGRRRATSSFFSGPILLTCAIGIVLAAFAPLPRSFEIGVPNFFLCSALMSIVCLVLSDDSPTFIVNPLIQRLGVVSFSAYLWHWFVLEFFGRTALGGWMFGLSRYAGMVSYPVATLIVLSVTYGLAFATFHLVEKPGMAAGRKFTQGLIT